MTGVILLALFITFLVLTASHIKGRPHTIIDFSQDSVEVRRGSLPVGLVHDLNDLKLPHGSVPGRLEIRGHGETLQITTHSLSDEMAQRIRNVVLLRKAQLKP